MTKTYHQGSLDAVVTYYYFFVAAWRKLLKALSDDGLDDMKAAAAVVVSEIFIAFLLYFVVVTRFKTKFDLPTSWGILFAAAVTAANFRLIFPNAKTRANQKRAELRVSKWTARRKGVAYVIVYAIPFMLAGCVFYVAGVVGGYFK